MWITNLQELKLETLQELTILVFGNPTSLLTKTVLNMFERINQKTPVTVLAVNIEQLKMAIHIFNIRVSPYIIIVKNGVIVDTKQLPFTYEELRHAVTTHQSS
jgi:thioredoxin-like negative regulator of GroEL